MLVPIISIPITALAISPGILPAALGLVVTLSSPSTTIPPQPDPQQIVVTTEKQADGVPVLEVVKIYGKLAGTDCFGKKAPPGSSCQIRLQDLEETFLKPTNTISRDDFASKLKSLDFQWPLKPYGINKDTLTKTAVMNKGAETYVFMGELEARNLYDPRNPTGPLPTSLRPALNRQLQAEGVLDDRAIDLVYDALFGKERSLDGVVEEFLDYYDFLKKIGPNSVSWPK